MSETKFCTGCQATKPAEGGLVKHTAGSRRWVCKACAERKSASIYQRPKKELKAQFDAKVKL